MTPRLTIFCLTILVFLTSTFTVYGQKIKPNKLDKTQLKAKANFYFDTSKTAIIPFDKKKNRFHPFDTNYKAATLTQTEMQLIDSLLISVVSGYNNYLDKGKENRRIELNKYIYRKQLIVATNQRGEKEVYVNCFCRTVDNYWKNRWKTELFLVVDGGQCFFDFKINLKSVKVYDFSVNGTG